MNEESADIQTTESQAAPVAETADWSSPLVFPEAPAETGFSREDHREQEAPLHAYQTPTARPDFDWEREADGIQAEINNLNEQSMREVENDFNGIYENAVRDYQAAIETQARTSLFEALELSDRPGDTTETRELKAFVRARFDRETSDELDRFIGEKYSGRQELLTLVQAVDRHLSDASALEAASRRVPGAKAEQLRSRAKSLRDKAHQESDRLRVGYKRAAREFYDKNFSKLFTKKDAARPTIDRQKLAEDPWSLSDWEVLK